MPSLESLRALVARHFRVYDAREEKVRGQLIARRFYVMVPPQEFDAKYAALREELAKEDPNLLALHRHEGGEDVILVAERPPVKPQNLVLRAILLVATIATTTTAGAFWWYGYVHDARDLADLGTAFALMWETNSFLWGMVTFALPLMLILGVHETAHYVVARRHGLRANLPMFIPAPLMVIGTFGAFISLKDPLPDRKALFDVGASGPLAGFVIALPVVVLGLMLTSADQIQVPDVDRPSLEGADFVATEPGKALATLEAPAGVLLLDVQAHPEAERWEYALIVRITHANGTVEEETITDALDGGRNRRHTVTFPAGATKAELEVQWNSGLTRFGEPLLVQGINLLFPPGGDYLTHPTYFAGWVGLLVTGLNLLPTGQLDGGHVSRAVFGENSRHVARITLFLLVGLAIVFDTWLLMALFVLLTGIYHPPPLNDRTPLDSRRKWLAAFVLLVFAITFVPIPFQL